VDKENDLLTIGRMMEDGQEASQRV
jgi:hypothetical protein